MTQIFDLGYPKTHGDPHYGLYQPVLDCFLLIVYDLAQAQEIKLLASPRYSLYVVDLTAAENYSVNLLDNTCCENWTLSTNDKERVNVGLSDSLNSVIEISKFEQSSTQDPDIPGEKQYLQTVWHHVKYCFHIELHARKQIHDWIDGVLRLDFDDVDHVIIKESIKKIKRILYLGTDTDQINNEIKKVKSQIKDYYRYDDFVR